MSRSSSVCGKKQMEHDISLLFFPFKDHERFSQWLVQLQLTNEEVITTDRVCSDHFTPDAFDEKWEAI